MLTGDPMPCKLIPFAKKNYNNINANKSISFSSKIGYAEKVGLSGYLFIYLFIYFIQFNDNKQNHHHSLKKSHRPHTKADHKKEKKKCINIMYPTKTSNKK